MTKGLTDMIKCKEGCHIREWVKRIGSRLQRLGVENLLIQSSTGEEDVHLEYLFLFHRVSTIVTLNPEGFLEGVTSSFVCVTKGTESKVKEYCTFIKVDIDMDLICFNTTGQRTPD